MFDFPSWIVAKDGKSYWNTDATLEAAGIKCEQGVGHSAVTKVWKIEGDNREGWRADLPKEFATDIRRGRCRKMMTAGGITSATCKSGLWHVKRADGSKEWWLDDKRHTKNSWQKAIAAAKEE